MRRWPAKPVEFTPRDVEEMELSFSRGFSHGWLDGCDHKMLVPAISSAKRGVLLGDVRGVREERVVVELAVGDQAGRRRRRSTATGRGDDEQGGRVYEVFQRRRSLDRADVDPAVVELAFGHGAIDFDRNLARPASLEDRRSGADQPAAKDLHRPIRCGDVPSIWSCAAAVGEPLAVEATTDSGRATAALSRPSQLAPRPASIR